MVHLIKLSVGPQKLQDLVDRQAHEIQTLKRQRQPQELIHVTRRTPRRAEEALDGGSIYWVIKGWIVARQELREFRPLVWDDKAHCGLVFAPEMILVQPRPRRPFQGWRYLERSDAPPDRAPGSSIDGLSDELERALVESGLL